MVRIPRDTTDVLVIEQVVAFPEPDHAPELAKQEELEAARDGWAHAYEGVDDTTREVQGPPGEHRDAGEHVYTRPHTGPRGRCDWPSHAQWFVDQYPAYKGRDDRHE